MANIVFVVGNTIQTENAIAVARHLPELSVRFLALSSGDITASPPAFSSHLVAPGIRGLLLAIRAQGIGAGDVIVLPQDVGLLQRTVAHSARRRRASVVLMPDGIAARGVTANGSLLARVLKKAAGVLLVVVRITSSSSGRWGASRPDLLLRWGPGWAPSFLLPAKTEVQDVGFPRADQFCAMALPAQTRLLVCSQPLAIPAWSRRYANDWYKLLGELTGHSSEGIEIRIRLHPAEWELDLPEWLTNEVGRETTLKQDIEWASHVASPFSTVLVEALAAGRTPLLMPHGEAMSNKIKEYPIFAHPDFPIAQWTVDSLIDACQTSQPVELLQNTYLRDVGTAGRGAAAAILRVLSPA